MRQKQVNKRLLGHYKPMKRKEINFILTFVKKVAIAFSNPPLYTCTAGPTIFPTIKEIYNTFFTRLPSWIGKYTGSQVAREKNLLYPLRGISRGVDQ